MTRTIRTILAAASLAALAACASLVTGGPLVRPGEATGEIIVINGSRHTVDVVLISDCGASTYGLNRMMDGEKIAQGQQRRFTVSAGCWDVDAGSFSGGEARQRMTVAIGEATTYTVR